MIQGDNRGRGFVKTVDWSLIVTYLVLVLIGWLNVYSSSYDPDVSMLSFSSRSGKQLVWIITAFGLGALILFVIPPRIYELVSLPIYVVVLVLLVAVIFVGTATNGSNSWFEIGPVKFQPAEISKISTSLLLASYMSRYGYRMKNPRDFAVTCLILLVPMMAILMENETGSMLVYAGFIFMLYREGITGWIIFFGGMVILLFILTLKFSPFVALLTAVIILTLCNDAKDSRMKHWFMVSFPASVLVVAYAIVYARVCEAHPDGCLLQQFKPAYTLIPYVLLLCVNYAVGGFRRLDNFKFYSIAAILIAIVVIFSVDFIFNGVLQPHQRLRIEVLLGITDDPSGVGYNVRQSMIAIGSGGLFGKGFLKGTQTTYGFVPEQSTDFIFCTVGEEWGFAGSALVICLYAFLIWKIIRAAEGSRENFTRIYGYCTACCIFMHLIINVGMTIGLMPVIGIPLPLLSYGGSSLWSFTTLLFIFIALVRNERRFF